MRNLKIFNSISGKKEAFVPIDANNIKMYSCGPTVYSRPHIGNMRSVLCSDVLFRVLRFLYSNVTYVRNITDVDDKIINKAIELHIPTQQVVSDAMQEFHEDCNFLNCIKPTVEPRATESIESIISMVRKLLKSGHAYEADKHVFFSTERFKEYGILSKKNISKLEEGARVEVSSIKKNPHDFVLWKPEDRNVVFGEMEEKSVGWNSPFGFGRPGWHIECSAMISKYLGENIDIHCGGVDLKFPHHENEIAQSRCSHPNSIFVKYWAHNGTLNLENTKMSKSLGNVIKIPDLKNEFSNIAIRYFLNSFHYRKPLTFTKLSLQVAQEFCNKMVKIFKEFGTQNLIEDKSFVPQIMIDDLMDDINTPKFFSHFPQIVRDIDQISKDNLSSVEIQNRYNQKVQQLFNSGLLIGIWNREIIEESIAKLQTQLNLEGRSLKIDFKTLKNAHSVISSLFAKNKEEAVDFLIALTNVRSFFDVKSSLNIEETRSLILSHPETDSVKMSHFEYILNSNKQNLNGIEVEKALGFKLSLQQMEVVEKIRPYFHDVFIAHLFLLTSENYDKHNYFRDIYQNIKHGRNDALCYDVINLLSQRTIAKSQKNFALSDKIRDEMKTKYTLEIKDVRDGVEISFN